MENYKNVSQDIRNKLDAEAKAVQIILTRIYNDIYSTVDACLNACEMWKATKRLKQEWQRSVTLVKQSQELKIVSYHKLYDILKQHQNKVNEIRAERLARTANPRVFVSQQQLVYHPQNHHTHYTQNSSTRPQQAATRNKGKAIVNSPPLNYDQEPTMVAKDDALSKEKEIDKLMALMDDADDKPKDQELEAHYLYMAQIQEVTLDAADNSGPIFDVKPLKKVQNDDDNYYVFANDIEHPEQPEYVNVTYPDEQGDTNITTDSLDMSNNGGEADQDEDEDISKERDLSLLEKLKCKIDESKDCNKLLESSNKNLFYKLKNEIKDFKNKNKCLESSNNHFKEANTELEKNNQLMFKDLKKFQAELDR
nr:hypothetical protein [Tanacetum cinerariifolium]